MSGPETKIAMMTRLAREMGLDWKPSEVLPTFSRSPDRKTHEEKVRAWLREDARPLPEPEPEIAESEQPKMGHVYFIRADDGPIKIGWAAVLEKRVNALQTASFAKLRLLASLPGTLKDEHALHLRFAHLRIRGEWFQAGSELLSFIAGLRAK